MHLVESNAKKASFLRAAQLLTHAPAIVHQERMEDFAQQFGGPVDIVTARAVLPLKYLLPLCYPLLGKTGAMSLFPKGQNAELEVTEASKTWHMEVTLVPSRTDEAGRIVMLRNVRPRPRR